MSSSSPASSDHEKPDVFISLCADDTSNHFASHLCSALSQKQIKAAFYDDDKFKSCGDEAIQEVKVSVVIFSEKYASSARCLKELDQIIRRNEGKELRVLPVFYNVLPCQVRRQLESYGDAMADHGKEHPPDSVEQWKRALTKAANLSGFDSSVARSESKLVDDIVNVTMLNLYAASPPIKDTKGLIGVDSRIEKIESLLQMDSKKNDVRIVGVYGAEGVGKTTLARALFQKHAPQFEESLFFENVKDEEEKHGLHNLPNILFSKLLKEKHTSSITINRLVIERLKAYKVLIVLDNVDDFDQFERLAGNRDWFCPGSEIIVTTRDEQVLNCIEVDGKYAVEKLNPDEALELFCLKAFKGKGSTLEFEELSKMIIDHANGIPKALISLGRHLCSRSIRVWKSELSRLEKEKSVIKQ